MMNASRLEVPADEPLAPSSLGTAAATLATCAHPEGSAIALSGDLVASAAAATWCAACGALRPGGGPGGAWQRPALTSSLTKKRFEDLVLLLHAIGQLAQLTRGHPLPGGAGSPNALFLRVRASLAELSRLPVVRDVGRLEEALAAMPASLVRPQSR
jgi:hypothetical protein